MGCKNWEMHCPKCRKSIMAPRGKGAFLRTRGVLFEGESSKPAKIICKNCGEAITVPIFLK